MVGAFGRRFRVGGWTVHVDEGRIRSATSEHHVRPLVMDLLVALARERGQVVSKDTLLASVWQGRFINESALSRTVAELRETLGDDTAEPTFIETVAKRGYRLLAPVEPLAEADHKRLVVLPFLNLSHNPEEQYFADGVADSLSVELGRFTDLRVISHQSARHLRETTKSVPEIARELRVDAVVEGSALRAEDRIRVTVRLVQPDPVEQLWADCYDVQLRDVLALQARLARVIAEHVRATLVQGEPPRRASWTSVDPEVHLTYLKARHHWNRWTPDGLSKGLEYLEEAIDADPGYAPAYAGLANCLTAIGLWAHKPSAPLYAKAKEAASLAVALDDSLSSGHVALGLVRWLLDWDLPGSDEELRRGIASRPSNEFARLAYALYLMAARRQPADAIEQVHAALDLDPISLNTNFCAAWVLLFAGKPDAALRQAQRTLDLHPDALHGHYVRGWALGAQGQWEDALGAFEAAAAVSRSVPSLAYLGHAYARTGQEGRARAFLEELEALRLHDEYVPPISLATIHAGLGDAGETFSWLDRAVTERDGRLFWLVLMPVLDRVRGDPRLNALIDCLEHARSARERT